MLKQTIKFADYNGNDREITEWFHLNEAEIVELQTSSPDGIQAEMQDAILSNDAGRVLGFIKNLVHRSYGKKSADGINFDKNDELLQKFITSAYYSDFLLGLIEDNGRKGEAFVQGIMPAKLVERALAQVQGQDGGAPDRQIYGADAREQFAAARAQKHAAEALEFQVGAFGQPTYPQFTAQESGPENPTLQPVRNTPVEQSPEQVEFQRFREWQAAEAARQATVAAEQAAPASPDAFRVREEEPMQGLPRPPHEQQG